MKYKHLFSEGKIGNLKLKNRVFMTAAGCGLANEDGIIGEELLAYYEARAKGGVGAIVTEVVRVYEKSGVMNKHQICATREEHIPEIKKLADRLHQYDCKLFPQLQHPGNVTYPGNLDGRLPVSPSGLPSLLFAQKVETLTIAEIQEIEDAFAAAAARCQAAGADGVELHGAHFYLIHQFLTPLFNKRTDLYGGSHENRMRFLTNIIKKIQQKCGRDYPVIVRISVEDYMGDQGYHLDEGIRICQSLEKTGIQGIDVTAAGTGCHGGQSLEPVSYKQGWRKHLAAAIKKMVDLPVISVALVREPEFAEALLAGGVTDFVGSARCFLADPEWSRKAMEGREDEIRTCISCLKCIDGIKNNEPISCSINPLCGREYEFRQINMDGDGRNVVIIGGGPAGMEAAKTAAVRGFKVTLMEREKEPGGQLYQAAQAPHKAKMYWYIEYMKHELKRLHVNVILNKLAVLEEVRAIQPYAVIDATGAIPIVPENFKGHDGFVLTPDQVLKGKVKIEHEHVVIAGSGMTGLETAEYLAARDNRITMLEMADRVAKTAYPTQVSDILPVLEKASTVIMTDTSLKSIEAGIITIENVKTGQTGYLPADKVILAFGVRSQNGLKDVLKEIFDNVFVVGDAAKSGRIIDAVKSGYETAINL